MDKTFFDGTHRVRSLQNTYDAVFPFLKEMGITRVANITGLDKLGIPVYMVCRPNSRCLSVSQGKGINHLAAKISGIMESIEGFHAERIDNEIIYESSNNLVSKGILHLTEGIARLARKSFDKDKTIPWVEGLDLISGKNIWIPFECVHANYSAPWPEDHGYFVNDSNGLASGNSLDEAINHALYEVIERDALALWSHANTHDKNLKKIDLHTITDGVCCRFIEACNRASVSVGIWDIGTDTEISSFLCKIIPNSFSESCIRPAYGSGSHLCAEIALSRAITEAAQSRLTFISGSRDDQYNSVYDSQVKPDVWQRWMQEISSPGSMKFETNEPKSPQSMLLDQKTLLSRLTDIGINHTVVVNLTKPEYNISVVKVLVPDLEGISYSGERIMGKRGRREFLKRSVPA